MVTCVHGYAEHSGRYEHLAAALTARGMGMAAFDLVGHGKSGGKRAFIDSFDHCIADLGVFRRLVEKDFPSIPQPIFAHSMGGAISILSLLSGAIHSRGIVLSSPAIILSESKWLQKASTLLARLAPRMGTIAMNRDLIVRDRSVVEAAKEDPLNYEGPVPLQTGAEMVRASRKILEMMDGFVTPFLIIHGTEDKLVEPMGSQQFFDAAASDDKHIKLYDGLMHETFNELDEGPEVVDDVVTWLEERVR